MSCSTERIWAFPGRQSTTQAVTLRVHPGCRIAHYSVDPPQRPYPRRFVSLRGPVHQGGSGRPQTDIGAWPPTPQRRLTFSTVIMPLGGSTAALQCSAAITGSKQGLSVISDIDDTIKITHVHDRDWRYCGRPSLAISKSVPGMAEVLRAWQARRAFHYVISQPGNCSPRWKISSSATAFPPGKFSHALNFPLEERQHPATRQRRFAQETGRDRRYLSARLPRRRSSASAIRASTIPRVYADLPGAFPTRSARSSFAT